MSDLAGRQHGVVARRQAFVAGLTATMLDRRVARGALVSVHRGVYAVGHARLRREGYWLAAVLAIGPGAVLSHRDAAALHEIRYSNGTRVDVSTRMQCRDRPGIRVHGRRTFDAEDVTTVDAIRTTTVARTLVDLAEVLPRPQLSKALSEAERLGKLDVGSIEDVLARTWGRRGAGHGNLRAALAEHAEHGATLTRSELEERFLTLLDAHRIPRPRLNAWIEGVEVDALWPEQQLAVELDGYAFHHHRRTFQRDREQGNHLVDRGYRVLRFTHHDVVREGDQVAAQLRRVLYPSA